MPKELTVNQSPSKDTAPHPYRRKIKIFEGSTPKTHSLLTPNITRMKSSSECSPQVLEVMLMDKDGCYTNQKPVKLIKHLNQDQVLDLYYNVMCSYPPISVLERIEFENKLSKEQVDEEYLALFYAIRTLCEQRMEMVDAAEESMELSKSALGKIYYDHTNAFVVFSYAYLSVYEAGCGRLQDAKLCMSIVVKYIDEMKGRTDKANNVLLLRKLFGMVTMSCVDQDVLSHFKLWPITFEKFFGTQLPQDWNNVLQQEVTESNYKCFMNITNIIEKLLHDMDYLPSACEPTLNLKQKIIFPSMCNGLKVAVLERSGKEREKMEKFALNITKIADSDLFPFAPSSIVPYFVLVGKVHLDIAKSIQSGERMETDVSYQEILQKDLLALQSLGRKYTRVEKFHKELLDEITHVLALYKTTTK